MSGGRKNGGQTAAPLILPPGAKQRQREQAVKNWENPEITVRQQDGAVIVSAIYRTEGDRETISARLAEEMENLAGQVETEDGLIGHIKASLEACETENFSVTQREVQRRKGVGCSVTIRFAAIVFLMEAERLRCLTEQIFEKLSL